MAFCGVLSKVSRGNGTLFSAIDPTRPTRARRRITVAEQLDMMVLQKAFKGDLRAYQEILDRLEGRAKQTNEIELSGGLQINWEEKKTYVENKGSL